MIATHSGNVDTSLEPSVHLSIPEGFTWPASLKKLVAEHDITWQAWADAELTQLEAQAALDVSAEADKALLIAAVAAGEPDPGTPTEVSARRAALYAEEASRQAAAKVNAVIVQIVDALPAHRDELITQAVQLERDAIAKYAELMTEAQALVATATAVGRTIGSRSSWLTDILEEPREGAIIGQIDEVQWPRPHLLSHAGALAALDRLAGSGEPPAPVLGKPVKGRLRVRA